MYKLFAPWRLHSDNIYPIWRHSLSCCTQREKVTHKIHVWSNERDLMSSWRSMGVSHEANHFSNHPNKLIFKIKRHSLDIQWNQPFHWTSKRYTNLMRNNFCAILFKCFKCNFHKFEEHNGLAAFFWKSLAWNYKQTRNSAEYRGIFYFMETKSLNAASGQSS